jgi:transposase-like protein
LWVQLDPKDGHPRGKQTYRCRGCHYRFIPDGNRHYFPEATKLQALDMYAEGTGITAAGRVLGVKSATIFSWVKKSPPGPEADGADDPAAGGAATGDGIGPGDFLR